MGYYIFGAGGHGRVVLDILLAAGEEVLGFLDDNLALAGEWRYGYPVLGDLRSVSPAPEHKILVAIGDNYARQRVLAEAEELGFRPGIVVHPSAVLCREVELGPNTVVAAGAVVGPGTRLGRNVIVNTGATVDHDVWVGDNVHISPGVNVAGGVEIGNNTHIGIGAVVLPGVKIGPDVVIGAGAVVSDDIPAGVTAVGVPARRFLPRREER